MISAGKTGTNTHRSDAVDAWMEADQQLRAVQQKQNGLSAGKESGHDRINRSPQDSDPQEFTVDIELPYYFDDSTDTLEIYVSPDDQLENGILKHTQTGSAQVKLSFDATGTTFVVIKSAEKDNQPEVVKIQPVADKDSGTFTFSVQSRPAVSGSGWEGSGYEKVFNQLYTHSSTYQSAVSQFVGKGAKYNLEMSYTPYTFVGSEQKGFGNTDSGSLFFADKNQPKEYYFDKHYMDVDHAQKGHTAYSNFAPGKDTRASGEEILKLNDLGRAFTLIHEAAHLRVFLDVGEKESRVTEQIISGSRYRGKIAEALIEFAHKNSFSVSDEELKLLSWAGVFYTKGALENFKAWIADPGENITNETALKMADIEITNSAAVNDWLTEFNEKIVYRLMYNKPDEPDRFMIKE